MSKELIRKAQEQIMFARAHVESTFMDPTASTELLADHARIHGQLTSALVTLQDAMTEVVEPQLPKMKVPKPESVRRMKNAKLQKAREAGEKPKKATRPPTTVADGLGVDCPQCKQPRGQFCVITATNGQPTDRMFGHNGGLHSQRRQAAGILKGKGKLTPWTPAPVVEPTADDEPAKFDDGTPMDPPADPVPFMNGTGLSDEEVIELLDQAMPGGMILIDGVATDVDKVRELVNRQ